MLSLADWDYVTKLQDPLCNIHSIYIFREPETFSGLYDIAFPYQKIKIKNKTLTNPWITEGRQWSSKRKQKSYEKFLNKKQSQWRKIQDMLNIIRNSEEEM